MRLPPLALLMIGAVLTLLCGGAILLLSRMGNSAEKTARTLAVLGPYRLAREAPKQDLGETLLERLPLLNLRLSMARLLGIDIKRHAEYPVRWWIVLAGTLAAARAAAWLIALVVDLPQLMPVPVLWVLFCRIVFGFFAKRRRDLLFRQFPDVLSIIVRALRVGQTVTEALRGAARDAPKPTVIAFARLIDRLAIGVPLAEALPEMADDLVLTEYRFFSTTLLLQSQTGGKLSEALDTLAEVIRGRVTLRRRAYAMAGEARASAMVLAALPVITFGGLMLTAPDYARLLVDDPLGRRVLGMAIGMLLVGGVIMNTMIQRLLP